MANVSKPDPMEGCWFKESAHLVHPARLYAVIWIHKIYPQKKEAEVSRPSSISQSSPQMWTVKCIWLFWGSRQMHIDHRPVGWVIHSSQHSRLNHSLLHRLECCHSLLYRPACWVTTVESVKSQHSAFRENGNGGRELLSSLWIKCEKPYPNSWFGQPIWAKWRNFFSEPNFLTFYEHALELNWATQVPQGDKKAFLVKSHTTPSRSSALGLPLEGALHFLRTWNSVTLPLPGNFLPLCSTENPKKHMN